MTNFHICNPANEATLEGADTAFGIDQSDLEALINEHTEGYHSFQVVFSDSTVLIIDVFTDEDDADEVTRLVFWVEQE